MAGIPPEAINAYGFGSYQGYVAENCVAQALLLGGKNCWQSGNRLGIPVYAAGRLTELLRPVADND